MPCRKCASENQTEFLSEISVHLRKPSDLIKPPVFIFPVITVCLDCYLTEFVFPKQELRQLTKCDDSSR
jgi:hypothetical protein